MHVRSLASHLASPSLGDPDLISERAIDGCAGGSCGVIAHIHLDVDDTGVIRECTARVRGRDVAYAAASALCEAARGRTVIDAARLGVRSGLHADFAEMDDDSLERALVVEDALHHAIGQWMRRSAASGGRCDLGVTRLVGMSGGVDSAVALHNSIDETAGAVAGITLRMWIDPRAPDPDAACCSPDSVRRARRTCHEAGMPHLSIDVRSSFAQAVVTPFVQEYAQGRTPNPCVACNGGFRLHELVSIADAIGAEHVVTGHYVRSISDGERMLIGRGVDLRKDQSYMLARLEPSLTRRFIFPLGESVKPDVRKQAMRLGLDQATVADSQEVCFLGGGDYRAFLARSKALGPSGSIVLDSGSEIVGSHDGIARFTPGQRRGLGAHLNHRSLNRLGVDEPLYVTGVEAGTGTVAVGTRASLARRIVHIDDVDVWVASTPRSALVQLRYSTRIPPSHATITWNGKRTATLTFAEPVHAPAPGQTACMYDERDAVIGVGTIVSSEA